MTGHTFQCRGHTTCSSWGDGQDTIDDRRTRQADGYSALLQRQRSVSGGISPAQVQMIRSGNDMGVPRYSPTDQNHGEGLVPGQRSSIERVQFADSTLYKIFTTLQQKLVRCEHQRQQHAQRARDGTAYGLAGFDLLLVMPVGDLLFGGGGNHISRGRAEDDVLEDVAGSPICWTVVPVRIPL